MASCHEQVYLLRKWRVLMLLCCPAGFSLAAGWQASNPFSHVSRAYVTYLHTLHTLTYSFLLVLCQQLWTLPSSCWLGDPQRWQWMWVRCRFSASRSLQVWLVCTPHALCFLASTVQVLLINSVQHGRLWIHWEALPFRLQTVPMNCCQVGCVCGWSCV